MKKDTAKKLLGIIVACVGGEPKMDDPGQSNLSTWAGVITPPTSFHFLEDGIKDIIIFKKDGTKLIIPFSEIIEALEKGE